MGQTTDTYTRDSKRCKLCAEPQGPGIVRSLVLVAGLLLAMKVIPWVRAMRGEKP